MYQGKTVRLRQEEFFVDAWGISSLVWPPAAAGDAIHAETVEQAAQHFTDVIKAAIHRATPLWHPRKGNKQAKQSPKAWGTEDLGKPRREYKHLLTLCQLTPGNLHLCEQAKKAKNRWRTVLREAIYTYLMQTLISSTPDTAWQILK